MAEAWATAPTVFVVIPTCPHCGSVDYQKVRTEAAGEGASTKKVICRSCSTAYKIVSELPVSGKAHWTQP